MLTLIHRNPNTATNGLFLLLILPTRYPHLLLCGSIKVPKIVNIILHLAQFGNILYNILRCQYETLSAFDTAHLLEDAFSLAYAGQLDYILVMNMMKYLKRGKHPIPWCVASSKLMYIYTLLKDGAFSRRHSCTDEEDRREHISANPNIRDLFFYYGMHYFGDISVWKIVFKQFIAENDRMQKLMLMRKLTAIKDISILEQFIVTATDEKYIRAQDFLSCLIAMSLIEIYPERSASRFVDPINHEDVRHKDKIRRNGMLLRQVSRCWR